MEDEKEKTQVIMQMRILKRSISDLETRVKSLRDKLEPVLRLEPVLKNGVVSSEIGVVRDDKLVPLATNLRETRRRVNIINSAVLVMLRKLEL